MDMELEKKRMELNAEKDVYQNELAIKKADE